MVQTKRDLRQGSNAVLAGGVCLAIILEVTVNTRVEDLKGCLWWSLLFAVTGLPINVLMFHLNHQAVFKRDMSDFLYFKRLPRFLGHKIWLSFSFLLPFSSLSLLIASKYGILLRFTIGLRTVRKI